jgi:hypothetical protein
MITLVVFSKDRALQCDSLLRSVNDHCTGIDRVVVLAKASSPLHHDAYSQLVNSQLHGADSKHDELWLASPDDEGALGQALYTTINDSEYTALAVDDQLFYRSSDFKVAAASLDDHLGFVWSWRLGYDPEFTEECPCPIEGQAPHWLTTSYVQSPDYSYLWHSDGALYRTVTYEAKLDMYLPDWRTGKYTPNDLEASVARRRLSWAASAGPHVGPLKPTCITWQLNRAQTKYGSPAAEIPETNLDALARAYLEGKRVDNEKLYALLRKDPQRWNPPGARPTHVYACEEASRFWASAIR